MKSKAGAIPSDNEAKAIALKFYKNLEKKEAAKRQACHNPPVASSASPQPRKSPRKPTTAPSKAKSIDAVADDASADLRARQYYDNYIKKQQSKNGQLPTPSPSVCSPEPNFTPSSTKCMSGVPTTSWYHSQKTIHRNSHFLDTCYNDMLKLEKEEAEAGAAKQGNPTFSSGSSQFDLSTPSTKQTPHATFGAVPFQASTNPFGTATGNNFNIPNTNAMKTNVSFTSPFKKESTSRPINTNPTSYQRPAFHPVPITKRSWSPPMSTKVHTTPVYSEQYHNDDSTTNGGWLSRLFTTFDIIIFVMLYLLELKFHMVSLIGFTLVKLLMQFSWTMIVHMYRHGVDVVNIPTTLMLTISGCLVARYSIRPSAVLLQSFRKNRIMRNDQIQSSVAFLLNMVYNELMKQDDVNVPIRSLQDMIFAQLFMDESMDSNATHGYILHSTKDRKYWMQTIWPRVVAKLLYRNPNVSVVRNIFNDKETYVRWTPRPGYSPTNDLDSIIKKRKAV